MVTITGRLALINGLAIDTLCGVKTVQHLRTTVPVRADDVHPKVMQHRKL